MISEKIDNTVFALSKRAAEGTLTSAEFCLGLEVLLDCAAQVRLLECGQVPGAARLTDDQLADGKIVRLGDRRRA